MGVILPIDTTHIIVSYLSVEVSDRYKIVVFYIIHNCIMNKIKVNVLKSLYPYNKGDTAFMREDVANMWVKKWFVEIVGKSIVVKNEDAKEVTEEKALEKPVADKSMANKKKTTKAL